MKILTVALLLLVSSTAASANTVYRWQDERGVTQYSDTRPRGVADVQVIQMQAEQRPSQNADAPAAATTNIVIEAPQCEAARSNINVLSIENTEILMDLDGDGQNESLTNEQRLRQLALAQAQADAFCAQ